MSFRFLSIVICDRDGEGRRRWHLYDHPTRNVLAVVDHGTYNGKMRLELCLFVENEQMAWCEPCRDVVNG